MAVLSFLSIILIPAVVSFITMIVVLSMQWMLEKEVNKKQPLFLFHIFNLLFIIMMCGTSSLVFHGLMLDAVTQKGWWTATLYGYIYPFPLILLVYIVVSRFFRSYLQPYRVMKRSNIIYLNKKRKKLDKRR